MFGGTFDPPHVGHLIAAADAVDALTLDRIVFVPAYIQPLKRNSIRASAEQRLAMTRLAAGDDQRLAVDAIEIDRAGLSFTVDTLTEWERRAPNDHRFILMGADVVRTLAQWRAPLTVMRLAELVVWHREGTDSDAIAEWLPRDAGGRVPPHQLLTTRQVDVSSTEVRARVAEGRSIRGFVPEAVREYIYEAGLYRRADEREEGNAERTGP